MRTTAFSENLRILIFIFGPFILNFLAEFVFIFRLKLFYFISFLGDVVFILLCQIPIFFNPSLTQLKFCDCLLQLKQFLLKCLNLNFCHISSGDDCVIVQSINMKILGNSCSGYGETIQYSSAIVYWYWYYVLVLHSGTVYCTGLPTSTCLQQGLHNF